MEIKWWNYFVDCFSSISTSVNGIAKTEQEQCQLLNSFSFHFDEGVESPDESCLSSALNRTKGDFA